VCVCEHKNNGERSEKALSEGRMNRGCWKYLHFDGKALERERSRERDDIWLSVCMCV